ncbi:MAG: hypothetical protein R2911_29415 [Caldilineaceae bacterium]
MTRYFHPDFIRPGWGGRCFAELPQAVLYWLTGRGARPIPRVVGAL